MILSLTVQLKAPYYTKDGTLYGMPGESATINWADEDCAHEVTVCVTCLSQWRNDYNVTHITLMSDGVQTFDIEPWESVLEALAVPNDDEGLEP